MRAKKILIIDDSKVFVEALVAAFNRHGFDASGCSEPAALLGWRSAERFAYDLILSDMRLGPDGQGREINAAAVVTHVMTYAPTSKIFVFSQQDITVKECVTCMRRGALAVLPKTIELASLVLITEVYEVIGDYGQAREQLIQLLWEDLSAAVDGGDGRRLEMLVINLFNSMKTLPVLGSNQLRSAGEIDIVVENLSTHPFWTRMDSAQLVVECKHTKAPAGTRVFTHLQELVKTKGRFSRTGVLVSVSGVSAPFKRMQTERKDVNDIHIFVLDKQHLADLVSTPVEAREERLRTILARQ
jgi:ActR/RegA family two-component response regulator